MCIRDRNNNNLKEIDNITTEEITPVAPKEVAEEIKFVWNLIKRKLM